MRNVGIIMRRELVSYFATPLAYIFIFIFLLVANAFTPGLAPAEPYPVPVHSGDIRVDVQSSVAMLAPVWGMRPLLDISDEQARGDLARASVMALSFVAQAARGAGLPAQD